MQLPNTGGMNWAFVLDGQGGGRTPEPAELAGGGSLEAPLWVHLDRTDAESVAWIKGEARLPDGVAAALLAEETRPRALRVEDGILLVLRAVNLNPGATPDDMIAIRLWVQAGRAITLRQRKLKTTLGIKTQLEQGQGPKAVGEFLLRLVDGIVDRIEESLENLLDLTDDLEERASGNDLQLVRRQLTEVRGQIVSLYRHLSPQRQVLAGLPKQDVSWLDDHQRTEFREVSERAIRLVEELDALRERGKVISDEIGHQLNEVLNQRMYVLSLTAALFLPLSLLAGIMGANVGGIPWAENEHGFWVLCGILLAATALCMVALWAMGWIGPGRSKGS
ncbi:MAG: zinc transporter ZntB [Planctomycetota bacterium]